MTSAMHLLSFVAISSLGSLLVVRDARASFCDDTMNMVNVNVPIPIVVQTIQDSGNQLTQDDIRCLVNAGAPAEVVAAARKLVVGAEPTETAVKTETTDANKPKSGKAVMEGAEPVSTGKESEEGPAETAADPEQIKEAIKLVRAKKTLTASLMLYEMLEKGQFPDRAAQIQYYLARCLYDQGMYHTAQYYYLQVVRQGPENPYFNYSLPRLVSIAKYTGDNSDLLRIVAKIPPESFPRTARNQLYYLLGVRLYDEEDLSRSRKYFGQISNKSDLYLRSKYYEGVIYNQQGKLKSAVRSFRDVVREEVAVESPDEWKDVNDLKQLSLINVARIYYSIQRFDESSKYYSLVDRESAYWPTSLFESAWSNFMRNDLNLALGEILTVQSPFFSNNYFIPEANVLKALTYFNLCDYGEVEHQLIAFEDKYKPIHRELKDFVQGYATKEGKQLADQAYETYFERFPKESLLPKSLFDKVLMNRDLAASVKHLQLMDDERKLIDQQKSQWRDSVGSHLKNILDTDKQRYKRRAGLLFLGEMARLTAYLGDLLSQSEIIRFEVVDAQRVSYEYKMQNPDLQDTFRGLELDFATSVDFVYWPFNGEFWKDELGYYHFTEQASCK
jgi:tetratricopeptide (TPR) repeat protein